MGAFFSKLLSGLIKGAGTVFGGPLKWFLSMAAEFLLNWVVKFVTTWWNERKQLKKDLAEQKAERARLEQQLKDAKTKEEADNAIDDIIQH